jgi:hypothetical protein
LSIHDQIRPAIALLEIEHKELSLGKIVKKEGRALMKGLTAQARLVSLLGLFVCLWGTAYAQVTPGGDSYTNTADPTTNYGAAALLDFNGPTQISYIQFNLSSIPTGASVSQATLKLYVNAVATAGSFNVDYVNGTWAESTIDASNAPSLGKTIASDVAITTADKNQYILVNVTSVVQAWLDGSETNNGIALVANSTFDASFDSKENTTTSHPAELDIAFAGGGGTITGVKTEGGSGLSGGGTSGSLDLSLTTSCAANQVLEWNGTAWACANPSGTGTITGVTAGTDLTGGGTSGNVTLNLNTSALNAAYAQLGAANTFTGNQTVNGNLSVTGNLSAGPVSGTASSANGAVTGTDTSSAGTGGVIGISQNGVAVSALGNTYGVQAYGSTAVYGSGSNYGVYGTGTYGVEGWSTTNTGDGVVGVGGTASGGSGVYGMGFVGVTGVSVASNAGVYAQSGDGGWAVDAYNTGNSTGVLAGSVSGYAGFFNGKVEVSGNLSKSGGSFKIDHPLDPANKYLYHSFVESPDMMNIYNGNVTTDAQGDAVVNLPDWFETLNRDFRYQLTVIGQFAQAIVSTEIADGRFGIKTDKPNVKVSWQVTGIRQDAWANAHRIPVEEEKPALERGSYLHPELFGAPEEKGVLWATAPQAMKQWNEARAKAAAKGGETPAKP